MAKVISTSIQGSSTHHFHLTLAQRLTALLDADAEQSCPCAWLEDGSAVLPIRPVLLYICAQLWFRVLEVMPHCVVS